MPDMDTPGAELPKSRLWTANYTRAWVANFLLFFSFMVMTPLALIFWAGVVLYPFAWALVELWRVLVGQKLQK